MFQLVNLDFGQIGYKISSIFSSVLQFMNVTSTGIIILTMFVGAIIAIFFYFMFTRK